MGKRLSSGEQRARRQRRGERAFHFDGSLNRCLAEFEREDWEWALFSARCHNYAQRRWAQRPPMSSLQTCG